MSTIEQSIDVEAPISSVYNQWTQFEEFPRFMDGVEEIRQLDDRRPGQPRAFRRRRSLSDLPFHRPAKEILRAWDSGDEGAGVSSDLHQQRHLRRQAAQETGLT